jgi:hypothetical protein
MTTQHDVQEVSTNPASIEINCVGQRLVLRPSGMDPVVVREVVDLVSMKIREVESRFSKSTAAHQITLLAMLDLAEEYVKAKQRVIDYQTELDVRVGELISSIEAVSK